MQTAIVIRLRFPAQVGKSLLILILVAAVALPLINFRINVKAAFVPEYERYVHNFLNDGNLGNWTYVEKALFPVLLGDAQIPVGQNWSIVVPLQAQHRYHAYLYGKWLSDPANRTDYDVYVYGPDGTMEGYHTASPPDLRTNPSSPFFVPYQSGNYTFTIVNDAGESIAAQQATFMIVENVETDLWHEGEIDGKDENNLAQYYTSWTYEFATNSSQVEIKVQVPDSLNMFEARLFLMANNASAGYVTLGGIPLPSESGLYGNKTGRIGGYNTDSEGYEGVAYATCDNFGQNMQIDFNSTAGMSLYHLVFIGEKGSGNIRFFVKTSFQEGLMPFNNPDRVFPEDSANISYVSTTTNLVSATFSFSLDGWQTSETSSMNILNDSRTCQVTIPPEAPGTQIVYRVEAIDVLEQVIGADGSYVVGRTERTYLDKPMFPVYFNESQIAVGREWSVITPLEANHSYHAYCYGSWIDYGSQPETDYDMFVYDPAGRLVGYHTQSAGLPPHLGTTVGDPFFVPLVTGNYTFVISNNKFASRGAQQATFMIIEDAAPNVWHERYLTGMDSQDMPTLNTSWAYEFVSDSQSIEVYVKVPGTLDMYEARLYVMTDVASKNQTFLNGIPLPWEPGLYGNKTSKEPFAGGFNLDSKQYRGNAYASCEFYGQKMFLNFTSPKNQTILYHLVLIGEYGNGSVQFLIKTEFPKNQLTPVVIPGRVSPQSNAIVAYALTNGILENAVLRYSNDSGKSLSSITMEIFNGTCNATLPGQEAGIGVEYVIEAVDVLENRMSANGSYVVKYVSSMNFTSIPITAKPKENVTITGILTPKAKDMVVTIHFDSANESQEVTCMTLEDGSFSGNFEAETTGTWLVYASFNATVTVFDSQTSMVTLQIEETLLTRYSMYIFGGVGAIAAVGIVLYVRKARNQ